MFYFEKFYHATRTMSYLKSSILELASQIQTATNVVHTYLQHHSLPPLSFSADAFPFFPGTGPAGIDPFPPPEKSVLDARRDVLQACETLLQLMATPADHLIWYYGCGYHTSTCLQYIYHFQIASAVPVDGETSYEEIARIRGVDEGKCRRILRMAMTSNYFCEPKEGFVAHTAGSKLLLNQQVNDTVGYIMEETFPSAGRMSQTAEKFGSSQERNESCWNVAHDVHLPLFEFLETNPVRMTRFLGHMESLGGTEGYNVKHLLTAYDWGSLGAGTVVDIGGSTGHTSFAIAEVAPKLRFVVQDLENVVAGVKDRVKDRKSLDRISFEVHSFFQMQPVKDAEVYLLRFICHDYSDKYAAEILRNVVNAMGPKSRIIVMDGVTPSPRAVSSPEERKSR